MSIAKQCIVCDRELEDAMPNSTENQPLHGTAFVSYGHYGSGVFDPMDASSIEINVCDDCLDNKWVTHVYPNPTFHPSKPRVASVDDARPNLRIVNNKGD